MNSIRYFCLLMLVLMAPHMPLWLAGVLAFACFIAAFVHAWMKTE